MRSFIAAASTRTLTLVAFVSLPAIGGCDDAVGEPVTDGADADRHPIGKADMIGGCARPDGDFCGGPSDGNCWCDEWCTAFGDCCSDYLAVCDGEEPPPDESGCTFETCALTGETIEAAWTDVGYRRGVALALLGDAPLFFVANDRGTGHHDPRAHTILAAVRADGAWTPVSVPWASQTFEAEALPSGEVCLAYDERGVGVSCFDGDVWSTLSVDPADGGEPAQLLFELSADADGHPLVFVDEAGDEPLARPVEVEGTFAFVRLSSGTQVEGGLSRHGIQLRYADGSSEVRPVGSRFVSRFDIARDGEDHLVTVHWDQARGEVVTNWQDETGQWRADAMSFGLAPALRLATNPDGQVWLAQATEDELRLRRLDAGEWVTVATAPLVGDWVMAETTRANGIEFRFDAHGRPHVATWEDVGVGGGANHPYGYYHLEVP